MYLMFIVGAMPPPLPQYFVLNYGVCVCLCVCMCVCVQACVCVCVCKLQNTLSPPPFFFFFFWGGGRELHSKKKCFIIIIIILCFIFKLQLEKGAALIVELMHVLEYRHHISSFSILYAMFWIQTLGSLSS